jgi:cell division protein FtsB
VKEAEEGPRGPRPLWAFFVSLAISSVLMGGLLLSDRRVLELKRARAEVQMLDRRIAEKRRENEKLSARIEAANRHEFPAEKVAREELHLVSPDDIVLLYPLGSLTTPRVPPGPAASAVPTPAAPSP